MVRTSETLTHLRDPPAVMAGNNLELHPAPDFARLARLVGLGYIP